MNAIKNLLLTSRLSIVLPSQSFITRHYAKPAAGGLGKSKKKIGKMGAIIEKKVIPVETDTTKLVQFVCGSNIYKEGTNVKIKPDNEYPEWLWTLNTGKPVPLEELDPNTKEYWRKLRRIALRQNNKLSKLKKI